MNYTNLKKEIKEEIKKLKTPFLLYDLDKIRKNYSYITKGIKPDQVFYAVKACKLPKVLKSLYKMGCKFEVNTKIELENVIQIGENPSNAINSAPIKLIQDIKFMYARGVRKFAFDCKDEVDKTKSTAPKAELYLRLFTSNQGSGQALNTKFGAPYNKADELIKYSLKNNLKVTGLTFSPGSQCQNLKNWEDGVEKCAPLFGKYPSLSFLNIGGGIPIKYNEDVISIADISKKIRKAISKHIKRRVELYVEPGRFLTGNTALTATSVIGIKENGGYNWAYVDASIFSSFLELFEFKENFQYEIETDKEGKLLNYNIAGPTCDGCDILNRNVILPELKRGDRLYFCNTGAYTLEYGSEFNGFPLPKVYYIEGGKISTHYF